VTDARAALIDGLATHLKVPPLTSSEIESILALAAVAAHGTGDRTSAPLASFLAGIAAATRGDRVTALDEARRTAAELAPPPAAV
jgi:Cdc6-like AAA superfamily ATPase